MSSAILKEIEDWEKQMEDHQSNSFTTKYDWFINQMTKKIDEKVKKKLYFNLDNVLFFSHAFLRGATIQKDAREQIVKNAKLFNPHVSSIDDLKTLTVEQLSFIAKQQITKEKLFTLIQGSITGSKSKIGSSIDLPSVLVLHLRAIQLIALSFGHDLNKPFELMLSLKLFHASTLPSRYHKRNWDEMVEELSNSSTYIYQGTEEIIQDNSLLPMYVQLIKFSLVLATKRYLIKGMPVLSVSAGAITNYYFLTKVTDFAIRFYQKRYFMEHSKFSIHS
ncbi:EcsC family protein [Aquibacillus salsiterrae]|uniref:EcsC family protein n=1 Tax=Aquibacillus salsiterrae TaxID=2950439 RepID=A0A9X3WB48_9BACI|nr:EcsC family protein [Aquibacillus salsiterrae]MDC3415767.1 EcsC family protein [Aquibacillus salsiterrae]